MGGSCVSGSMFAAVVSGFGAFASVEPIIHIHSGRMMGVTTHHLIPLCASFHRYGRKLMLDKACSAVPVPAVGPSR